jgi:RHS repeat-associated protein
MNSYAAISSIGFRETIPEHLYVPHYLMLLKSLIDACLGESGAFAEIPCSVFSSHIHHTDPEPNWYIYHSDHLGSSAFLTDASGDPTQHLQYMPFGETFVEQRSITSYYTPYTFSAKERDLETGYSYFGARYYDADISVWLSVDPMADKYPSMSAYMYCAGNPVMLVDPDGREIVIYGDDGSSITYRAGMNYDGSDKTINAMVASLNSIYSTSEGQTVLNTLISSNNYYSLINSDGNVSDLPHFCANNTIDGKSGGQVVTQGNNNVSTLSHELFHAYQDEMGQGGASIHNEIEAYVFQTMVENKINRNSTKGYSPSFFLVSKAFISGEEVTGGNKVYETAAKSLTESAQFSPGQFTLAMIYFKNFSAKNQENSYGRYPLWRSNQTKFLINQFYK